MADAYLWTLHTLTLCQMGDAAALGEIVEQDESAIESALERAVNEQTAASGRGAYMITPKGREVLDEAYPDWFAAEREDESLGKAIDRFETGVNKQVLQLTTEWQTIDVNGNQTPNDHGDPEYDRGVIDRLGATYDKAVKVLAPFIDRDPTMARFAQRLGDSLAKAEAGEIDYVSSVRLPSFHTVWFQMHEHLLRVMGRERPE